MIPLLVFDLETTAADPLEARIVTAYLGVLNIDGKVGNEKNWVIDQGVDIPEEAAKIHGYPTERISAEGRKDAKEAISEIARIIATETRGRGAIPLAGQNISYDCTVLDRELRRYDLPQLTYWPDSDTTVVDSLVLDKAIDKYRKGSRKLIDMAAHYGIPISEDEAHSASFDAVAAGRIVQAIFARRPGIAAMAPEKLHEYVEQQKRSQAASLQEYFRTKGGKPDAVVDGGFPLYEGQVAA